MTALGTWKLVGSVAVDTASILIGDPCGIVHTDKPVKALGKDWDGFLARVQRAWGKTDRQGAELPPDRGQVGLAVVVGTGYGDGLYKVWGRFAGDMCCEVRITFDNVHCGIPIGPCDIAGCTSRGAFLCDFKIKKRGQKTVFCERRVCAKHRHEPTGNDDAEDYCPAHAKASKKPAPKAATRRKAGK